nr:hypothetical protein LKV13_04340 [Borrelia sp. BU AG58]
MWKYFIEGCTVYFGKVCCFYGGIAAESITLTVGAFSQALLVVKDERDKLVEYE